MIKLHFIANNAPKSRKYLKLLLQKFYNYPLKEATTVVVLGGDGFLLHTLHTMEEKKNIYGINCGGIGFLMNNISESHLLALESFIATSHPVTLVPLKAEILDTSGKQVTHYAFNEVSLIRTSAQAAHLSISINDHKYLDPLICDGILASTPAGSTAYNYSANGPILPLKSNVLALTPTCPFRPRRWKGAILSDTSIIQIEVQQENKRPVSVVADFIETRNIKTVKVFKETRKKVVLLFNEENGFEQRVLKEQFQE